MQLDRFSTAQFSEDRARQLLREVFGYAEFRGQQEAIIAAAVAGRRLARADADGRRQVAVLSDTRARARRRRHRRVAADRAHGGSGRRAARSGCRGGVLELDVAPRRAERRHCAISRHGRLKLLYLAPERLLQEETQALLREVTRLDHRDRRSALRIAMGPRFSRRVSRSERAQGVVPGRAAHGAHGDRDPPTRAEIVARLELDAPRVFVSSFDRPNIRYAVQAKTDARRQLLEFLRHRRGESGIVYCLSRDKTESIAEWLVEQGFAALPYHAGLPAETRAREPAAVPRRRLADHRRDDRVRHGHRQARRAVRRAPRSAEEHRGVLPGDGPRRPRRRARRRVDGVRAAGRRAARAVRRGIGRRRAAQAPRARQARRACSAGARSRSAGAGRCSSTSASRATKPAAIATTARRRPRLGRAPRLRASCCRPSIARGRSFGAAHVIDVLLG